MIELVMVLCVCQVEFFDDAELRFFVKRFMCTVENAKLFEVRENGNRHPAREPVTFHLKDRVLIFRKVDEGFFASTKILFDLLSESGSRVFWLLP